MVKEKELAYSVERIAYRKNSLLLSAIRYSLNAISYSLVFSILFFTSTCFAKDINFEATVDRDKVGLGQSLQINHTFNGTQNMPALELPAIEGFQARYLGPSTRMSIINGRIESSITHIYTLLPIKVGIFKIGPFKFEHNGDTYNSNSISVEVIETAEQSENQPSQEAQPEVKDLNERIFLTMQVKKNKVYLNEVTPVTIKLFVNKLGVRDIQYPQFSHDGLSVGAFEQPKQYQEIVNGISYDVIEFDTRIFGLRQGELRLGEANLQCNLIVKKQIRRQVPSFFDNFFDSDVFDNFLGGYQTYPLNLKSTDIPITILPLPEENKPEGFSGAVGLFDFEAAVTPLEVKVGDPITLKATVRGQGNFNTVTLPVITSGNDFKVYEAQVKQEKTALADGNQTTARWPTAKAFEQVLIPLNAAIKEIPAINFNFFNTQTGKYETITSGAFPIRIVKSEKEEELKIIESKQPVNASFQANGQWLGFHQPKPKEDKLGRDIIYIKDAPGQLRKKGEYLYKNKLFIFFQIIPLLLYLLIAVFQARNRRIKTDIKYARQLLAPKKARSGIRQAKNYLDKGNIQEFYDVLFKTLQEYLGDKFHLPSKGITISVIDEHLRNKNVPEEILISLRDIFRDCDMVRYAASQLREENTRNSLRKIEEIIDYLQRHKV